MIVFSSVTKAYGGRTVLDDISFRIDPGEFVCLTGISGAGKSTVINLLIRADVPTRGTVEVDGVDLARLQPSVLQLYRRRTGVVFQDYKLLGDRTVYENVAFAMEVCGDDDSEIAKQVPALLARIGLPGREKAFPRQLSGGERARVALARALVHRPMILIADEPTGNIDPKQSLQILALLKQVHAEGTTIVLASHDQTIIDALQTRVMRLEGGKIVRDAVGGYDAVMTQPLKSPLVPAKHKIFDQMAHDVVKEAPAVAASSFDTSQQKIEAPLVIQPKKDDDKKAGGPGRIKPIAI